ncbi:MAG: ATP-binding cassette domain-containing protein, partial [Lachnoclostridium sp.]|nr:ATP-binding cassette domain-containing protein [Lachnoclostridium sp.]
MLTLENVSKKFRRREVLKNISFQLEEGCYGLLGPNGAGKTTLLRCILKLYPIDSGSIMVEEENQISYLPQKFGMFRELSVYDMLYYFSAVKKIPKVHRKEEIEKVLSLVNLEDRIKEKISRLSGGMQRRLGIAQAIMGDSRILFFDEPTAGLDPEERARFKSLISSISENKTILISTHIVEDIEVTCDRVIILKEGNILKNSTVSEACAMAIDETNKGGLQPTLEDGYLAIIKGENDK